MGVNVTNNNQGGRVRVLTSSPSTNSAGVWIGSYLLNQYPGAIAAYSLRKVRKEYTGPVIRVRRSSDNTEQDIGFTFSNEGSRLDQNALLAFVGSADGFVTRWYDQSGNGVDQIKTVANQQPQIVIGGSTYTSNGKLALYFNGSTEMNSVINIFPTSVVGEWSSFGVIHPLIYDTVAKVYLSSDTLGNRIGQFLSTANNVNPFYRTVAFNTTPTNTPTNTPTRTPTRTPTPTPTSTCPGPSPTNTPTPTTTPTPTPSTSPESPKIYWGKFSGATITSGDTNLLSSGYTNNPTNSYRTLPSGLEYGYILIPTGLTQPTEFRNSISGCNGLNIPFNNIGTLIIVDANGFNITYNIYRTYWEITDPINVWMCN